jgi:hypothetical protein
MPQDLSTHRMHTVAMKSLSTNNEVPINTPNSALSERLDELALAQGFGYKAANIMVLQEQAEQMSAKLGNTEVKVPPFKPFSDNEIRSHLGSKATEIDQLWSQFLETFTGDRKNLSEMQISEEGRRILKEIRSKITEHFSNQTLLQSSKQVLATMKASSQARLASIATTSITRQKSIR